MTIIVNGKERDLAAQTTVAALLEELGLDMARVAVERNREIVPRDVFETTPLTDGDRIELVQFVGGG